MNICVVFVFLSVGFSFCKKTEFVVHTKNVSMPMHNAWYDCLKTGRVLASVNSREEENNLWEEIRRKQNLTAVDSIWIGLYVVPGNVSVWIDGSSSEYISTMNIKNKAQTWECAIAVTNERNNTYSLWPCKRKKDYLVTAYVCKSTGSKPTNQQICGDD